MRRVDEKRPTEDGDENVPAIPLYLASLIYQIIQLHSKDGHCLQNCGGNVRARGAQCARD